MISNLGNGLSVLIITETGKDWQTFATWYSINKNLPEATVVIDCLRNEETPFQFYQWTKRINIPTFHHKPFTSDDLVANWLDCINKCKSKLGNQILVTSPLVVTTSPLDEETTKTMNSKDSCFDQHLWFLRNADVQEMIDKHFLEGTFSITDSFSVEAKNAENAHCLVSYKKGCGKWIHTLKGCPFSNAAGLVSSSMTVNENRIIELWKRMCSLYSVIN